MNRNEKEDLRQRRLEKLVARIAMCKKDMAERLLQTKKIFKNKVYAVDIHCHSNYSDGLGTPLEDYECAKNAGLDFLFITDHLSIKQKLEIKKYKDASWGQEPNACHQHIGLLNNSRLFTPLKESLAEDFRKAGKLAPFVWIPHPAGWYPSQWYNDEQIEALWTIGENFAMEVMNGANKVIGAYDAFDAKAVRIWDRLLCDGKRVTAVGGSDAHIPDDIGSVWTGVSEAGLEASSIISSLRQGNCFASEAPLMSFFCNGKPMGSEVKVSKKTEIKLSFKIADSAGIASFSIVSNGRVLKHFDAGHKILVRDSLTDIPLKNTYYRLEAVSSDRRRAFSTPVFIVLR